MILGRLLALCAVTATSAFFVPVPNKALTAPLFNQYEPHHWALDNRSNHRGYSGGQFGSSNYRDDRNRQGRANYQDNRSNRPGGYPGGQFDSRNNIPDDGSRYGRVNNQQFRETPRGNPGAGYGRSYGGNESRHNPGARSGGYPDDRNNMSRPYNDRGNDGRFGQSYGGTGNEDRSFAARYGRTANQDRGDRFGQSYADDRRQADSRSGSYGQTKGQYGGTGNDQRYARQSRFGPEDRRGYGQSYPDDQSRNSPSRRNQGYGESYGGNQQSFAARHRGGASPERRPERPMPDRSGYNNGGGYGQGYGGNNQSFASGDRRVTNQNNRDWHSGSYSQGYNDNTGYVYRDMYSRYNINNRDSGSNFRTRDQNPHSTPWHQN